MERSLWQERGMVSEKSDCFKTAVNKTGQCGSGELPSPRGPAKEAPVL